MKQQENIHHNYIFFWLRGTGKTSAARILAKALNCNQLDNGNPCNICENCKAIIAGETLDYVEIDAASHTWVDNIREEILAKAIYPPTQLRKKIYIIDEVHMLSNGAFNALLKTIEEPRDNVCFILATTEIHKIPDTIISRCQVFNFKKIISEVMVQHLKTIAEKEQLSYEESALDLISKISEGSVRDAVKYVDQISILGNLSEEHASKFLGIASEGMLQDFIQDIRDGDTQKVFEQIETIQAGGIDLLQFTKQLILHLDKTMNGENINFNLQLAEAISEILGKIRYYPYPAVIYKMVLNRFMNNKGTEVKNKLTPSVNKSNSPQSSFISPRSTTGQEVEAQEGVSPLIKGEVKEGFEKKETNKNASTSLSADEAGSAWQEQQEEKAEWQWQNTPWLREQILEKAEQESFWVMLKKYCTLDTTDTEKYCITTINKMAELSLKKEENIKKLQGYFTELGADTKAVEIIFKNKEDFLKEGLL